MAGRIRVAVARTGQERRTDHDKRMVVANGDEARGVRARAAQNDTARHVEFARDRECPGREGNDPPGAVAGRAAGGVERALDGRARVGRTIAMAEASMVAEISV